MAEKSGNDIAISARLQSRMQRRFLFDPTPTLPLRTNKAQKDLDVHIVSTECTGHLFLKLSFH